MSKQSEAVKLYFLMNNIKQKDAAERLNLTSANLSTLVNGGRPIGRDIAHRMAAEFGFNLAFLLTGEGELIPSPGKRISVNQENVSVGGDNIIASTTTTTNNTTNQTTEGQSDTSRLKRMCHDLLERIMELEQENCDLRCKLNNQNHE